MNNIEQKIQEITKNGINIEFGPIFDQSIANFKKIALPAGLAFLLFSVVLGIIFGGGFALFIGANSMAEDLANFNIANFSVLGIIGYFASLIIIASVIAPFYCGILKMAHLANKNEEIQLVTAFDYYKSNQLKEIILAAVYIALFSSGVTILLELIGKPFIGNTMSTLITFWTIFVNPLIIFGQMKATEAIGASIKIVSKKSFLLLGLLFVALIICCLGAFGLCIGVFFTIPFIFSMEYVLYKNIIDFSETNEIDEIGSFVE